MKKLVCLVMALMLALSLCSALADYPEKEINMIIPYGAGGTTDTYGRTIAALLEEKLGQSIVCTNMAGASGSTGSLYVKDQPSDGYTLLVCAETMGTYRTMGVADLGYDNFTVITPLVGDPKVIVVAKDSPYQTLEDLLTAIKENPGEITMSHSGPGGSGHNQGLVLGQFGYEVTMVTSDGGAGALKDVLSGEVDFTNPNISTLGSYLESGELRPLAVFSDKRMEAYPDIPAFTEVVPEAANYLDIDYTVLTLCVNNDTPAEVVDVIRKAAKDAVAEQTWLDFVAKNAATPLFSQCPDEESANAYYKHWQSVVCWMQYDNGVAPNSPEQYGIERP